MAARAAGASGHRAAAAVRARRSSPASYAGVAAEAGTTRLAVRSRPTADLHRLVVAFPWRRRGKAEALGHARRRCARRVDRRRRRRRGRSAAASRAGAQAEPGDHRARRPHVPLVAVTGTNGKTTTSRMVARMAPLRRPTSSAGRRPTASTSTASWWRPATTPGRAARPGCSTTRGCELAVTETARGGILLRGLGVVHNDVVGRDERQRRPPRAAGHRHRRPARRGEGGGHPRHPVARLGRAQRRRPADLRDAARRHAPTCASSPATRSRRRCGRCSTRAAGR